MVKVIIGGGGIEFDGWILTDLPVLDALKQDVWRRLFELNSIDRILLEHVVEHWHEHEFNVFLNIVSDFLSPGGFVRLAVPDGFHPSQTYIDQVRPGGHGDGADDHKMLYDYVKMSNILTQTGYQFRFVEHFDESGEFHQHPWDVSDGKIRRSAQFDHRNAIKPLTYTSLIVDFWPTPKT